MTKIIQKKILTIIGEQPNHPEVSIIIVAYKTGSELLDCLNSLKQQTDKNFEVILVDNDIINQSELQNFNLKYFCTGKNLGPSSARNIGLKYARADIVAFLDDDGICEKNWVKNIKKAFVDPTIIALRGKIIPKNNQRILNQIQSHYDLGDKKINYYIDLEGNSAFRKAPLVAVGGFESSLFGHEGAELSYKLQKNNPQSQIVYSPDVVIFHEYADSFFHLFRKSFRHGLMASGLNKVSSEITTYVNNFYQNTPKKQKSFMVKLLIILSRVFTILGEITSKIRG